MGCPSIITVVTTPYATRLIRDRTAVRANYHKLASSSVTLHQSQQLPCVRVCECFLYSICESCCAFKTVCGCICVRECAQGKGNEDHWGSFKQPGFTSREVSWSSIPPRSRGRQSSSGSPSLIISNPHCIRTQPHASENPAS